MVCRCSAAFSTVWMPIGIWRCRSCGDAAIMSCKSVLSRLTFFAKPLALFQGPVQSGGCTNRCSTSCYTFTVALSVFQQEMMAQKCLAKLSAEACIHSRSDAKILSYFSPEIFIPRIQRPSEMASCCLLWPDIHCLQKGVQHLWLHPTAEGLLVGALFCTALPQLCLLQRHISRAAPEGLRFLPDQSV